MRGKTAMMLRRTLFPFTNHKAPVPPTAPKPKTAKEKAREAWIADMEALQLPVKLTHYYSPLPDLPAVIARQERWYRPGAMTGIDLSIERQRDFLARLAPYRGECDELPPMEDLIKLGYGLGFGEVEARLLYLILRFYKPRHLIEVGSGVSTYYAADALKRNQQQEDSLFQLDCIEPYPAPRLQELAAAVGGQVWETAVQDVDVSFFEQLGKDDVLFIDSTHVSKLDSDLNYLVLQVLPRLHEGVVVHFHDIPFPYPTCPPGHPLFRLTMLWNEAPLVQAFLTNNDSFRVLLCSSYLHYNAPDALTSVVPLYDPAQHFPSSLWLVKTGKPS